MPDPLRIHTATRDDVAAATALAFAHRAVAAQQTLRQQGSADSPAGILDGLWVAYRGASLVAAIWAQLQPGNVGSLLAPRAVPGEPRETLSELLQCVVTHLQADGARFAQALLETEHSAGADLFVEAGFRHLGNLLYLVSLSGVFPTDEPRDGLNFSHYADHNHRRVADLVLRTYVESRDCPEIDGLRGIDEVLDGYRAAGVFDPARWLIAQHQGADVGCVLLADHPHSDQWELSYLGVVPEARGRGWGLAMTRYAQWLAREAGRGRVVLAVDAANAPAIAVYAAAGFISWDHRSVFLRVS